MKHARETYAAFAISVIGMLAILLIVLITEAFACGGEQPSPFTLPFTAPALHSKESL